MEQNMVTDYMKQKKKEKMFKGVVSILVGFMLVLLAIFSAVLYFSFYIACMLVIAGIICFIAGIYVIRIEYFEL